MATANSSNETFLDNLADIIQSLKSDDEDKLHRDTSTITSKAVEKVTVKATAWLDTLTSLVGKNGLFEAFKLNYMNVTEVSRGFPGQELRRMAMMAQDPEPEPQEHRNLLSLHESLLRCAQIHRKRRLQAYSITKEFQQLWILAPMEEHKIREQIDQPRTNRTNTLDVDSNKDNVEMINVLRRRALGSRFGTFSPELATKLSQAALGAALILLHGAGLLSFGDLNMMVTVMEKTEESSVMRDLPEDEMSLADLSNLTDESYFQNALSTGLYTTQTSSIAIWTYGNLTESPITDFNHWGLSGSYEPHETSWTAVAVFRNPKVFQSFLHALHVKPSPVLAQDYQHWSHWAHSLPLIYRISLNDTRLRLRDAMKAFNVLRTRNTAQPTRDAANVCLMYMQHINAHLTVLEDLLQKLDGLPLSWVMRGPMQLNQPSQFPWQPALKALCNTTIEESKLVLSSIAETRSTILEQAELEKVSKNSVLTILATIYVPLSFVATFFGMNTSEINDSAWPLWTYVASAVPLAAVSVLVPLFFFPSVALIVRQAAGRTIYIWIFFAIITLLCDLLPIFAKDSICNKYCIAALFFRFLGLALIAGRLTYQLYHFYRRIQRLTSESPISGSLLEQIRALLLLIKILLRFDNSGRQLARTTTWRVLNGIHTASEAAVATLFILNSLVAFLWGWADLIPLAILFAAKFAIHRKSKKEKRL